MASDTKQRGEAARPGAAGRALAGAGGARARDGGGPRRAKPRPRQGPRARTVPGSGRLAAQGGDAAAAAQR